MPSPFFARAFDEGVQCFELVFAELALVAEKGGYRAREPSKNVETTC